MCPEIEVNPARLIYIYFLSICKQTNHINFSIRIIESLNQNYSLSNQEYHVGSHSTKGYCWPSLYAEF